MTYVIGVSMNPFQKVNSLQLKLLLTIVSCPVLCSSAEKVVTPAAEAKPLRAATVAFDDVQFRLWSTPFSHDGLQLFIGDLWSDSATGRRSYLLRWTKGTDFRHKHLFSYQVVVIKGKLTHWSESIPETADKILGPGSVWYAAAGEVHIDKCLVEECLTISTWFNPGDSVVIGDGR